MTQAEETIDSLIDDIEKAHLKGFQEGKKAAQLQWISVEDRLPEEGAYLAVSKAKPFVANYGKNLWQVFIPGVALLFQPVVDDVTHWMPLPQPPEEKE